MPRIKVVSNLRDLHTRSERGWSAIGRSRGLHNRAAFTLADLLVSITIMVLIIAIMLPTLSGVREMTRRVVCSSNVRQVGLAVAMYADEHNGLLPPSRFVAISQPYLSHQTTHTRQLEISNTPQNAMVVRPESDSERSGTEWDGLGWLYALEYLSSSSVFYCPSHRGRHPYVRYSSNWSDPRSGQIVANYHFRGAEVSPNLFAMSPRVAIVCDGLRTQADYNHRVGTNVLRADISVDWYSDPSGIIGAQLPIDESDTSAADKVSTVWETLDSGGGGSHGPGPGTGPSSGGRR